jgi:hypothetical protein
VRPRFRSKLSVSTAGIEPAPPDPKSSMLPLHQADTRQIINGIRSVISTHELFCGEVTLRKKKWPRFSRSHFNIASQPIPGLKRVKPTRVRKIPLRSLKLTNLKKFLIYRECISNRTLKLSQLLLLVALRTLWINCSNFLHSLTFQAGNCDLLICSGLRWQWRNHSRSGGR